MNTTKTTSFDVIVVGELNVDLILNQIESFPEMGKEKIAQQMTLTLGSSAAIFASNLSSLGAKVAFFGKIGRDLFANLLVKNLPVNKKDVVLLKVLSEGMKDDKNRCLEYTMMDYYDEKHDITAMMRTTSYPVSIIAQMIERDIIKERGVFCSEEVVPCKPFFEELKKRKIQIKKKIK